MEAAVMTSPGRIVLTVFSTGTYFLAAAVMVIRSIDFVDVWALPFAALLTVWCASPIAGGVWLSRQIPGDVMYGICFAALALIAVAGFAEQWRVMFLGPVDALNGVIFLFVPFYQWLMVGVVFAVAFGIGRYVNKS
jgi:hypothetical protein